MYNEFYAVWFNEEYVGKFFCGAFSTQELAEAHIAALIKYDLDQHEAYKKYVSEEYHEYQTIGTYSWSKDTFDRPAPMFVENI